jgi:hypothetical protein
MNKIGTTISYIIEDNLVTVYAQDNATNIFAKASESIDLSAHPIDRNNSVELVEKKALELLRQKMSISHAQ